jgi:transcriptional regulator with XRE-family HTH domain
MAPQIGPRRRTVDDDAAQAHRYRCGQRLSKARIAAGLTTYRLATLCGFSDPSIISRYEGGVLPSLPRQFCLARMLEVEPNELWGFEW